MKTLAALFSLLPLIVGSSILNYLQESKDEAIHMNNAPQPCCSPDQFEGLVAGIVGVAANEGEVIFNTVSFSYDRNGEKTNMNGTSTRYGQQPKYFRVLALHEEGRQYVVNSEGNCEYYDDIGEFQPICVPAGATYLGRNRKGFGENVMEEDVWMFKAQQYDIILTVTPEDCVILGQVAFGKYNDVGTMTTFGLENMTQGIKDPSVFIPPSDCQPGQQKNWTPGNPLQHQ